MGIDIGEINGILLETIEEISLYLIKREELIKRWRLNMRC
jgi:hypothetical protein